MEAYRHQVGGHSCFMKLRNSPKVLKPFSKTEYEFYELLASLGHTSTDSGPLHILKQYVPKYYGITEIFTSRCIIPHEKAANCPVINKVTENLPSTTQFSNGSYSEPTQFIDTNGMASENEIFFESRVFNDMTTSSTEKPLPETLSAQGIVDDKQHISNKRMDHNEKEELKYIVLQDLVYLYKKPCVLDLKMGRRQRKLGASVEKERSQLEKSLKSTSHSMGFRVCGFQSYDRTTDALCYRDKYWGRSLTKEKVFTCMKNWFWDGVSLYHELIYPLLRSLQILHACVSELKHYRFWSSSLLWVYDGGVSDSKTRIQSLDVKMIDFANMMIVKDSSSADDEYLYGLSNLMSILEKILASSNDITKNCLTVSLKTPTLSAYEFVNNDEETTPSVPPPVCDDMKTNTSKPEIASYDTAPSLYVYDELV